MEHNDCSTSAPDPQQESAIGELMSSTRIDNAEVDKAKVAVVVDVCCGSEDTDFEALAVGLESIARDGLHWGTHTLVPVAFGLKKLRIQLLLDHNTVSSDELIELITDFDDEVYAVDLVEWKPVE